MTAKFILDYCLNNLEGSIIVESWGESGIFYNPEHVLKRGVYILTIKEKDGANDRASKLTRKNVYRLNIGIRKPTFLKIFGFILERAKAGGVVAMDYDFVAINQIIPHPVYAWMGWISVLNPSSDTFEISKPFIQESYEFAK